MDATEIVEQQLREFLETQPLYSTITIPGVFTEGYYYPDKITAYCLYCDGERPYKSLGSGVVGRGKSLDAGFKILSYMCTDCEKTRYRFDSRGYIKNEGSVAYVEKIGQYPPQSIEPHKDIVKFLGDDKDFYKKGLMCLSQGYGLGAQVYFRRIVENKARDILELLIEIKVREEAAEPELKKLRQIAKGKQVGPILKAAAKLLPASVYPPGNKNPLTVLYDFISVDIHTGSEEECIVNAKKAKAALEYLIPRIAISKDRYDEYKDVMTELTK